MFSHIVLGTNDIAKSKAFYDAALGALGVPAGHQDGDRAFYMTPTGILMITKPINGEPATFANGGTIGFAAASPEAVDAFHKAGCAAGGTSCEDPPGVREGGFGKLYLAYMRDPAGNKICAMHRMS